MTTLFRQPRYRTAVSTVAILAALLLTIGSAHADDAIRVLDPEPEPTWIQPGLEGIAFNVAMWSYDRYVKDYGFSHIDPSTMYENLSSGWVWDKDQFSINQFWHPYQGSFYYSAARYYGNDFYVSTAFTTLGSLQWEYFMEAEHASYNDLITTTLGGSMFGEVTFRLSNAMLDPNSKGFERFLREFGATVVNPINGFNRLLSGETYRGYSRRNQPRFRRSSMLLRATTGEAIPFFVTADGDYRTRRQRLPRANTEVLVIYGDEFKAPKPYDYFILNLGVNIVKNPVSTVSARAQIASTEIYHSAHQRGQLLIGQNFDYIDNGMYKLGVSGVGGGYAHIRTWGDNWYHTLHTQIGIIPLGGVSTEFFRQTQRDYNLGAGAFSHTRIALGQREIWHTAFVSDRYWLHTRSGVKGDEFIGNFRFEVAHSVWKPVGVAFSLGAFDRLAKTRDHGTRSEFTQEGRLLLTYGFQ